MHIPRYDLLIEVVYRDDSTSKHLISDYVDIGGKGVKEIRLLDYAPVSYKDGQYTSRLRKPNGNMLTLQRHQRTYESTQNDMHIP